MQFTDQRSMRGVGFTLVELLVVMAIISILAALLLPVLNAARRTAQGVACIGNEKQLAVGAALYASDWPSFVPVGHQRWRYLLLPYLYPDPVAGKEEPGTVYDCPSSRHRVFLKKLYPNGNLANKDDVFNCDDQSTGSTGQIWMQVAFNYSGPCVGGSHGSCNNNGDNWYWPLINQRAWRMLSESVYVADSVFSFGSLSRPTNEGTLSTDSKGTNHISVVQPGWPAPIFNGNYTASGGAHRFADRHGGTSCLFADGHARLWNTLELETMVPGAADCIWDAK